MIGQAIKEILEAKDLTAYRLSKNSGVSQSYISEILNGKYKNPSLDVLQSLAKGLGVPVTKLFRKAS